MLTDTGAHGNTDHERGDGCAIYDTGYPVKTPEGWSDVEDLKDCDLFNDPGIDATGVWWQVVGIWTDGDDVHVDIERP